MLRVLKVSHLWIFRGKLASDHGSQESGKRSRGRGRGFREERKRTQVLQRGNGKNQDRKFTGNGKRTAVEKEKARGGINNTEDI